MRRAQCEITDQGKIEEILSRTKVGRLATKGEDGYPYITPVNFLFHRGCVYFHCAPEGEKLSNLLRDPRVCFEVDEPLAYIEVGFNQERNPCKAHQLYRCVIIRGVARLVDDGPLKTEVLNLLVAKHEERKDFHPVAEDSLVYKACRVVEIVPRSITAKADLLQGKPQEVVKGIAQQLRQRGLAGDIEVLRELGLA